jgi:hypothetical protein
MSTDSLPFTIVVPEVGSGIVEVIDQFASLKMAIVDRLDVPLLSEEWNSAGVYLLLDRHDSEGNWGCYVGKAPGGIRARMEDHVRKKDHWYRAILIRRDNTYGFNSAHTGFLEGCLYNVMHDSEFGELHNSNKPSDETLPPYERKMLEQVVLPVRRILQLIGHDPSSPGEVPISPKSKRTNRVFGVTVEEIIRAGLLDVGAVLTSTNGVWPATCRVLDGGSIEYNGTTFPTPSAAAVAVKSGPANGWEFWAIQTPTGLRTLASMRTELMERDGTK